MTSPYACQSCSFGHPDHNPVEDYVLAVPVDGWGVAGDGVLLCRDCASHPDAAAVLA
jgi:hypothetical protein